MKLYVTVGAPGCGKSTYLQKMIEEKAISGIVSSTGSVDLVTGTTFTKNNSVTPETIIRLNADELRGLYGKDEMDQSVSAQAFDFIAKACHVLFRQGFSVAIDVTSKDKRARGAFIAIAKRYGARTKALVFDTPLHICLARNAKRDRVVPSEVVERIYNQIQHPLPGEFDEVEVITNWK